MADQVELSYTGIEELGLRLRRMPAEVRARLREVVGERTVGLRDGVKEQIVENFHSTGPLYKSVGAEMSEDADSITGTVFTRGIPYARPQEFGGTWQIPEIVPVRAKVLAFMYPGRMGFSGGPKASGMIFTKRTRAHPVTLPARSYMRVTLHRQRQRILAAMSGAVDKGARESK